MKDMTGDTQQQMPLYKCYKKVWALKIKEIKLNPHPDNGVGAVLSFEEEGYADLQVSADYLAKHEPIIGGYYVVYKDGYKSFSPADSFEDGYMRVR